ncbi:MAG TPA: hypothetical protein VLT16_18410 [Candidatus Limnocylindrales bacterium]|nr:hypothetical protein [Candidatus Limnocylindrales bacterium]
MQKKTFDRKEKIARLNRYVFVVALLWLAASLAVLLLSGSAQAQTPQHVSVFAAHAAHVPNLR